MPKSKKPAKFVQITFHTDTGDLFALDAKGVIWRRDTRTVKTTWYKQLGRANG